MVSALLGLFRCVSGPRSRSVSLRVRVGLGRTCIQRVVGGSSLQMSVTSSLLMVLLGPLCPCGFHPLALPISEGGVPKPPAVTVGSSVFLVALSGFASGGLVPVVRRVRGEGCYVSLANGPLVITSSFIPDDLDVALFGISCSDACSLLVGDTFLSVHLCRTRVFTWRAGFSRSARCPGPARRCPVIGWRPAWLPTQPDSSQHVCCLLCLSPLFFALFSSSTLFLTFMVLFECFVCSVVSPFLSVSVTLRVYFSRRLP